MLRLQSTLFSQLLAWVPQALLLDQLRSEGGVAQPGNPLHTMHASKKSMHLRNLHLTMCLRTLRARLQSHSLATLWPRAARAKGPGQGNKKSMQRPRFLRCPKQSKNIIFLAIGHCGVSTSIKAHNFSRHDIYFMF